MDVVAYTDSPEDEHLSPGLRSFLALLPLEARLLAVQAASKIPGRFFECIAYFPSFFSMVAASVDLASLKERHSKQ